MTAATRDWLLRSRPFLLYPPVMAAVLLALAIRQEIGWAPGVLLLAAGVLVWTLLEWLLHRLMHVQTPWQAFSRFQDEAHLGHHRMPRDLEHSVVRLRGSLPLALVFFGVALAAFRDLDQALAFHVGLLGGYVYYEFVHLASHGAWRMPFMRKLARYHALHHHQDWNRTFGVTTPLWDWVFRTLPQDRAFMMRTQSASNGAS